MVPVKAQKSFSENEPTVDTNPDGQLGFTVFSQKHAKVFKWGLKVEKEKYLHAGISLHIKAHSVTVSGVPNNLRSGESGLKESGPQTCPAFSNVYRLPEI